EPVFAEIASVSKDNSDANLLEAAFDRQALENLYKNAPEILKPQMRIKIDLANLRILARAPKQANGAKLVSIASVSFGTVSRDEIIALFGKGDDAIAATLKNRIPFAAKFPDVGQMEIEMENAFLRGVRRTSADVFGPGPAISYFISRFNEARNVRAVLLGKQSNLEPEIIRALLRFAD
ncbi:MAG: V-type ATPase subunit, partial [Candidatus Thermoplasmatota archaeon]|nr:V-type ATPase subunit [Candidatus Thermoplasmatota archaeon]